MNATVTSLTMRGVIERLYFASPQFSAGLLATETVGRIRFKAGFHVEEGMKVTLEGSWAMDPKYGRQFEASQLRYDLPLDADGLAEYLSSHPDISGIGQKKARKIADVFSGDFERVLREEPDRLRQVAKLADEHLRNLQDVWQREATFNRVAAFLSGQGLTHHKITTLIKQYGNSIVSILQDDPYAILGNIKGFGFRKTDDIAQKVGIPKEHPGRLRAALLHVFDEALDNEGHTCLTVAEAQRRAGELLALDSLDAKQIIADGLDVLVTEGELVEVHGEYQVSLSKKEAFDAEMFLADCFVRHASVDVKRDADIPVLVAKHPAKLNPKQQQAAIAALTRRVSVMSGGAGVGKTYTIQTIVAIANDLGLDVELAAPTGKAAKRMEQVVGIDARTIHRLLEYHPEYGFQRNEDYPLDCDVLIVDEVSMVDVFLAVSLFKAIDFERTSIVLVGDHNQLPPVGPGNLLRDVIKRQLAPVTILDEVVRQAGLLKENSSRVLSGEVAPTSPGESGTLRPWYVVGGKTETDDVMAVLLGLFESHLDALGLDPITDVQVLAPQHKGPIGVQALNIALQRLVQLKRFGVQVPPPTGKRRPQLYPGDKVIQTRNDYTLGVMNGEMGVVASVSPKREVTIRFDNGVTAVMKPGSKELRNISLAYALTIHKSQGSEFPCVIAIIHKSHAYTHDRCLLYTAVTRARKSAIIIGDSWGIRNCAQKVKSTARSTILGQEVLRTGVRSEV